MWLPIYDLTSAPLLTTSAETQIATKAMAGTTTTILPGATVIPIVEVDGPTLGPLADSRHNLHNSTQVSSPFMHECTCPSASQLISGIHKERQNVQLCNNHSHQGIHVSDLLMQEMRQKSDLPADRGFLVEASIWEGTPEKARQLRPHNYRKF